MENQAQVKESGTGNYRTGRSKVRIKAGSEELDIDINQSCTLLERTAIIKYNTVPRELCALTRPCVHFT